MSLYFAATEITGLYFGDTEITGLYFGDTEIWAAWAEYDGTLPATYSANGSMLVDYRVYGSAGGVGDRTENLFDYTANDTSNGYVNERFLTTNGTATYNKDYYITEYIRISSETTYQIKNILTSGAACAVCFYDENKVFLSGLSEYYNSTFLTHATSAYLRLTVQKSLSNGMLVQGSTAPASYVPYGYGLSLSVTSPKSYTCEVNSLQASTNYAKIAVAELPTVKVGDKVTVTVGGTDYTLPVKNVDSSYVYIENMEV